MLVKLSDFRKGILGYGKVYQKLKIMGLFVVSGGASSVEGRQKNGRVPAVSASPRRAPPASKTFLLFSLRVSFRVDFWTAVV